jgi:hypothetical protein
MSPRLRRSLQLSSLGVRIGLSVVAFAALFAVSWMIYMPVAALLFAPISLFAAFLLSHPPSPLVNSVAAVALSGALAAATATAVFRVLLARARRRAAGYPA